MAPAWLFVLYGAYLIILLAGIVVYNHTVVPNSFYSWLHDMLPNPISGAIPLAVLWFGALGAILNGLYGIFDHAQAGDWDDNYDYWHIARPLTGAILGLVAYLIFHGVIQTAATGTPAITPPKGLSDGFYYVLAFLVGYREQTFRNLVQRATDLILGPGQETPSPGGRSTSTQPPPTKPTGGQ